MTLILISHVFNLDNNLYFLNVIVLCLYDCVPMPVPAVITWRVQISGIPARPSPSGQLINSVSHLITFMLTSERPHSTYCILASSDGANYSPAVDMLCEICSVFIFSASLRKLAPVSMELFKREHLIISPMFDVCFLSEVSIA